MMEKRKGITKDKAEGSRLGNTLGLSSPVTPLISLGEDERVNPAGLEIQNS